MDLAPSSTQESSNKVWLLRRTPGDREVEKTIARLDDRTLAATAQLFDRTELLGPPRNIEKFRHLGGDVYEFKVHRAARCAISPSGCRLDGWLPSPDASPSRRNCER